MIVFHYLTKLIPFEVVVIICIVLIVSFLLYNVCAGKNGSYDAENWSFVKHLMTTKELLPPPPPGGRKSTTTTTTRLPTGVVGSSGSSKGEVECRRVIERLTGKSFPKERPDFLRNDVTLSNLELDCFNEDLRIAVEYNGEQHYKYSPYFHTSKESFYNVKYRDDMKRRLCEENGVDLIVVPYTVPFEDIEDFIGVRLRTIHGQRSYRPIAK